MPSRSSRPERNVPQQDRSSRRLEALLDTAEEIFAGVGYDAATMTAIARRAGTSIGGLYRYFPDKMAVARALAHRYGQQAESYWASLIEEGKELPVSEFADRLLGRTEEFATEHPAYLSLMTAPYKFARDAASRRNLRMQFAKAFEAKNPSLSPERALLIANVVLQIVKGMMTLYAEAPPKDRSQVNAEFKRLLADYLRDVLE